MRSLLLVLAMLCFAPWSASALTLRAWGSFSHDGNWPANLNPAGPEAFSISFDHLFQISDAEIDAERGGPVALPVTGSIKLGSTTFKDTLWLSLAKRGRGLAAFVTARQDTPAFGKDDFQISALFGRRGSFAGLREKKQFAPLRDMLFLRMGSFVSQSIQGLGIIRLQPVADAAPVPLPAAGWLLASVSALGLTLGRRRRG